MRSEIEQAVALFRQGDEEAIEKALTLLQNTVFSCSMKVCGQREDGCVWQESCGLIFWIVS